MVALGLALLVPTVVIALQLVRRGRVPEPLKALGSETSEVRRRHPIRLDCNGSP